MINGMQAHACFRCWGGLCNEALAEWSKRPQAHFGFLLRNDWYMPNGARVWLIK